MESKSVVMLVTIMIVMVTGNLLIQTEAQSHPFLNCYPGCIVSCAIQKKFPNDLLCPFTCFQTCLAPPPANPSPPSQMISTNEINHNDYYCKLGCATHHCVHLSSVQNPSKFFSFYESITR